MSDRTRIVKVVGLQVVPVRGESEQVFNSTDEELHVVAHDDGEFDDELEPTFAERFVATIDALPYLMYPLLAFGVCLIITIFFLLFE